MRPYLTAATLSPGFNPQADIEPLFKYHRQGNFALLLWNYVSLIGFTYTWAEPRTLKYQSISSKKIRLRVKHRP